MTPSCSLIARLRSSMATFAREEDGSATIWCLLWLLLFVGIAGLAIDSTNGFRNKTMLQSTADVAALAGAWDIPNPERGIAYDPDGYDDVKTSAIEFAHSNMGMKPEHFGSYLRDDGDGIQIGHWDVDAPHYSAWTPGPDTDPDDTPVNAVRVNLYQYSDRGNAVATTLLRVAGFMHYDVHTTAIAILGYDECYLHAFMSGKKICQTTASAYNSGYCLYAHDGINLRTGNTFGEGATGVTPPTATNNVHDSNFAAGFEWGTQKEMIIPMVDKIPQIAHEIMLGGSLHAQPSKMPVGDGGVRVLGTTSIGNTVQVSLDWNPDWDVIAQLADLDGFSSVAALLAASQAGGPGGGPGGGTGGPGGGGSIPMGCPSGRSPGSLVSMNGYDVEDGVTFNPTVWNSSQLEEGHIYYYEGNRVITINGDLANVTIVSHGKFKVEGGSTLRDVTLVSLDDSPGGPDGVSMNGSVTWGHDTGLCDPEGGVKIYSMGSIGGSSGARWAGALLVSGGSIGMAADSDSPQGMTAYAKGNLFFTSANIFNDCGVPKTYDDDMLEAALVH